jgi:hypothetical protein
MPIFKLIKKYANCPDEWEVNMLFSKSEVSQRYKPLDRTSDYYVSSEFVENNKEYWKKYELDIDFSLKEKIEIPISCVYEFKKLINTGLEYISISDELKKILSKYIDQNKDFPGSTKL